LGLINHLDKFSNVAPQSAFGGRTPFTIIHIYHAVFRLISDLPVVNKVKLADFKQLEHAHQVLTDILALAEELKRGTLSGIIGEVNLVN
jgi:hypothetical protein